MFAMVFSRIILATDVRISLIQNGMNISVVVRMDIQK